MKTRLKVLVAGVGMVIIAMAIMGVFMMTGQQEQHEREVKNNAQVLLAAISVPCVRALSSSRIEELDRVIEEFAEGMVESADVESVAVLDNQLRVVGHTDKDLYGRRADDEFSVLAVAMPLDSENAVAEPVRLPSGREILPRKHDDFHAWEREGLPTMRYFLEPVVRAVGYVQDQLEPDFIDMVGVSGGGWTTSVVAALDPRIRNSYAVAGSLPYHLQTFREIGDFEQSQARPLYGIASWMELYALAALEPERSAYLIYNQRDPSCFAAEGREGSIATFALVVSLLVEDAGGGAFSTWIDTTSERHWISHEAESLIVAAIAAWGTWRSSQPVYDLLGRGPLGAAVRALARLTWNTPQQTRIARFRRAAFQLLPAGKPFVLVHEEGHRLPLPPSREGAQRSIDDLLPAGDRPPDAPTYFYCGPACRNRAWPPERLSATHVFDPLLEQDIRLAGGPTTEHGGAEPFLRLGLYRIDPVPPRPFRVAKTIRAFAPDSAEVIALMLGDAEQLPGPCQLENARVLTSSVAAVYRCGPEAQRVRVEMHPRGEESPQEIRTTYFSLRSPDAQAHWITLLETIAERVRNRETGWRWQDVHVFEDEPHPR